ncbi:MAG TPA: SLBB domain-containing protein [Myxococcales bacterium]|nr:SLBB domain-containing protein [Myxococcales bacterium]
MTEHFLLGPAPYSSLTEYRAATGADAVALARASTPANLLAVVAESGLRGRGGAGFPAGTKWRSIASHPCPVRSVVCNAAEGEPGTFKDRWLLRHNPYAVLEGVLIAAHAVGARSAYIALKASFTREIARVNDALAELQAGGALGGLRVSIARGPEEYLFGEEKALLEVIEGNDPLPRSADEPPYERGLFATPGSPNPALVSNAETLAHVPSIVRHGAGSFRELGTRDTPGTLLFTVSGDVRRPGVYERPAGITLRELFCEAAGGPREGRQLKAALSGVSVAPIAAERFDTPADFGSLALIGSGLGSAGFIVYDDAASMPRVAQMAARFLYVESCNQCSACKHGLRVASTALDALFDAQHAGPGLLARARYGALSAPQGNRCYLPAEGAAVIPGLLSRFAAEFDQQLREPGRAPQPLPVPKIADWDDAAKAFVLDERQQRKRPDWTYEHPHAPPDARARPAPAPHDRAHVGVPLPAELVTLLRARAERESVSLETLVERALESWLHGDHS